MDIGFQTIELNNNRGFLACGVANSIFTSYSAAYLTKVRRNGDSVWQKQYNFSHAGSDAFTDILELPDKNYLLLGTTYDSIIGNGDVFLSKIDTSGSVVWFKKYTNNNIDQSAAFAITSDYKVIIVGNTTPNSSTYNDILLIKTDTSGNLIWRKTIGNLNEEVFLSVQVHKNNNEYLFGGREGYYNMSNPYFDFGILRTDTAGNLIWRNKYGTVPGNEPCGSAIYTLDGGFALSGTYSNQGALMKLDAAGNQKWIKNFTMGVTPNNFLQTVKQLSDSSFAMIGAAEFGSNVEWTGILLKADKYGNQIWQRKFKGKPNIPDYFYGFNPTSDGGFIITGQYNNIGQPYQNTWLIKTDSMGCDSAICSFSSNIIISSIPTKKLIIFPNPNRGVFYLRLPFQSLGKEPVAIYITDLIGRELHKRTVVNPLESPIELNDLELSPGVYIVKAIIGGTFKFETKIIIQ